MFVFASLPDVCFQVLLSFSEVMGVPREVSFNTFLISYEKYSFSVNGGTLVCAHFYCVLV